MSLLVCFFVSLFVHLHALVIPSFPSLHAPNGINDFTRSKFVRLFVHLSFSVGARPSIHPFIHSLHSFSFFPIWSFARFTEIFYWGTTWAFLVQYGSSESARRTRDERRRRRKERERERQRRERLVQGDRSWWQFWA